MHSVPPRLGSNGLKRILIVDDEVDVTTPFKIGLGGYGYDVDTYNSPTEALSNFKSGVYDIIILDIRMPKMNGFELFRELKKKDEKANIWFLTAFEVYLDEFRKMFPDVGVNHFIRKPIGISELADRIKESTESVRTFQ